MAFIMAEIVIYKFLYKFYLYHKIFFLKYNGCRMVDFYGVISKMEIIQYIRIINI